MKIQSFKNLKKKSKKTLCTILILVLFFELIPHEVHAFLIDDITEWLSRVMVKYVSEIAPGEIVYTEEGNLELRTTDGDRIWGVEIPDENVFSKWKLGESKMHVTDIDGSPKIQRPTIPSLCELKVVPSPDFQEEGFLTIQERRLLNEACYDYLQLARMAANIAYFGKYLYNRTDPLSDCFMFRNCKSHCAISLGTIYYTVTWLEILELILPTSWVSYIVKIVGIIEQLTKIYDVFKPLYEIVKKIGESIETLSETLWHGKIFLKSFGKVLKISSEDRLRKILGHYADNMIEFNNSKSAALAYITNIHKEIDNLISIITLETPGVRIFFGADEEKRKRVEKIFNDYISKGFETPKQIIEKLKNNGEFLNEFLENNGQFKKMSPVLIKEKKENQKKDQVEGICFDPTNNWINFFKDFHLEIKNLSTTTPLLESKKEKIFNLKTDLINELNKLPFVPQKIGDEVIKGPKGEDIHTPQYWKERIVEFKCPNGELVNDEKRYFCKITDSACPSGWKQYENWTETESGSCHAQGDSDVTFGCHGKDAECTTKFHKWSNVSREMCTGYGYHNDVKLTWTGADCRQRGITCTAYANITKIGCIPSSDVEFVCDYNDELAFFNWNVRTSFTKELNDTIFREVIGAFSSSTKISKVYETPVLEWVLNEKIEELKEIKKELNEMPLTEQQTPEKTINIYTTSIKECEEIKNDFSLEIDSIIELLEDMQDKIGKINKNWRKVIMEEEESKTILEMKKDYIKNILDIINLSKELIEKILEVRKEFED